MHTGTCTQPQPSALKSFHRPELQSSSCTAPIQSPGLKLHHSPRAGLVDDTVAALLAPDGVALSQGKAGATLSTVVLDAQGLGRDVAVCGMRDGCGGTEPFSLGGRHGAGADARKAVMRFFYALAPVHQILQTICRRHCSFWLDLWPGLNILGQWWCFGEGYL